MNIKKITLPLLIVSIIASALSFTVLQTSPAAAAPTCPSGQKLHADTNLCWTETEPKEKDGAKTDCPSGTGSYSSANKKCNEYAGLPTGANIDFVQCADEHVYYSNSDGTGKCAKPKFTEVTGKNKDQCNDTPRHSWRDEEGNEACLSQDFKKVTNQTKQSCEARSDRHWTNENGGTCWEPEYEQNDQEPLGYGNQCRNNETGKTERVERECNADETDENSPAEEADEEGDEVTCAVDGVGWIVCPISNFLSLITDGAYGIISGMLDYNLTAKKDARDDLKSQWSVFANIANVAFIIVFLIVIFSHVSGLGIDNYSLKRMLPRLIVGAILVNVSFYICVLAIDISNILGNNLKEVLEKSTFASGVNNGTWEEVMSSILMGGAAVGGGIVLVAAVGGISGIYALLGLALPVLLAALVAIITVFLILIARQALITILIVIAPLAFVANLLPNTEQWYKRWQKTFVGVLIIFPAVAILFGGAKLAAGILTASNTGVSMKIFALGVQAAPLFLVLAVLKKLIQVDGLASMTKKVLAGKHTGGALTKHAQGRLGAQQAAADARNMANPDRFHRFNPLRYGARLGRSRTQRGVARQVGDDEAASALEAANAGYIAGDEGLRQRAQNTATNKSAAGAVNAAISRSSGGEAEMGAALGSPGGFPELANILSQTGLKAEQDTLRDIEIQFSQQSNTELANSLRGALSEGNQAQARALSSMLLNRGNDGSRQFRDVMIGNAAPPEIIGAVQSHIASSMPGLKASDASAYGWATDDSMRGTTMSSGTADLSALKVSEVLSQRVSASDGYSSITPEQARIIQNDPTALKDASAALIAEVNRKAPPSP